MGGEVVPSYLRSKLSSILDEAEADSGSPSHIISRFRSIESQIKSSSPMMIPVDLLYELIDLLSECRMFIFERRTAAVSKKGFGFYFPKLLRHPPLSELMFNRRMRRRLDIMERKIGTNCTPSLEPSQPPAPIMEKTYPIGDTSLIIGFEAEARTIKAWLMPKQEEEAPSRVVGIVGRCGCGKTALAQKVFNDVIVKKEFSPRIWVCLSNMLQFVDRKVRVVNHILREIHSHAHDHCSLDKPIMERLQLGLRGKRYLIVLDNAWRLDEWYEELLSHGLPSGGAVIVTSRREDLIRRMVGSDDKHVIRRMVGDDDKHVIRLEPHLSDEICWQIFTKVLQLQGKFHISQLRLSSIEDDVKRNFDGLPLGAKILANILPDLLLKTYWVRARNLSILRGNDDNWWRWTSLPPPQEMEEVAELVARVLDFMSIEGRVGLKELLMNTRYSAYLVFKLKTKDHYAQITQESMAKVRIVNYRYNRVEYEEVRKVNLETKGKLRKGEEEQGWREMKLGDIFTTSGDDGSLVEAEFKGYFSGLVVKGIEFRPPHY